MEESSQSPNKSVTEQDKKLNPNANTVNGNNDDHLTHTPSKDNNKETKFNASSIISPQSTKSLNLTDNNSNHSSNTTTSNITASSTNNPSPSHPNINRTFIKNSKLTIKPNANTSRYNYVQNQNNNNNNNNNSARPEQKCKENEAAKKKMIPFDNELVLQNLIRAQIEYLFSDYHLTNDTYLLARMQDNPQHWLSIDELCHNQKIRCLTIKKDRILRALRESKYLQLSPEQDKVRRPDFTLPKLKPNRDLRRTVFLYGIPSNKSEQDIRKLLSQYGHIKRIHFQPHPTETDDASNIDNNIDDEAPNKAVAQLIMKKKFLFPSRYSQSDHDTDNESNRGFDISTTPKGSNDGNNSDCSSRRDRMSDYAHPVRNPNGDTQDFSHLKTCFVVFESQSQATKCVKARVRAIDGMRCIHKYDYNKVAKKFRTAQMKGEKLSFSPPPPNYQSPRISSQGEKYMHNNRGRSPGAQSDGRYGNNYGNNNRNRYRSFGNGQGNNNGYGNNRNRNDNRNRDYNSYRDRSHSQSSDRSQGSDRGDRDNYNNNRNNNNRNNNNNGGGYQSYRQGRYERNGQGNRNQRSQTPNYKSHGNNNNNNNQNDGNNKFYNILGRNQRGGNDDNDKENHGSGPQRSRGLGRRQDRDSHDNTHGSKNDRDNSSDVRTYHSNRNKWNQNPTYNRNSNRHAQSTSPQRSQSVGHSVGNQSTMSTNSEYKPILNSMNKGQNGHKGDNNKVGQPQQDLRKVQSGGSKQNINDVANQPTYAKKRQPVRAATPNMKPNGSFVSPMGQHDVLSPPQDLKKTQSSMQPGTVNNAPNKKLQQQPLQRSVSANTAPTSTGKSGAKGGSGREPAAPQLYHPIGGSTLPTRQDAADLRAAGYNHELYYLPVDDPNFLAFDDIYQDPLMAYDVYFGVDQSGKPTSTSAAAQQLQQQKTQIQTQPKAVSQSQRHHTQSQYAQQSSRSQHAHATYVPQQQPRSAHHSQQRQYATTPTHHSSSAYAQQSAQYAHQQHPQLSSHSYSAHSYQSGPSSAPYGPVQPNAQQQQYRAEQWQLDKLEKFKAQKQAEQAAQHHQHQVVQQQKPATALSVLSSSN